MKDRYSECSGRMDLKCVKRSARPRSGCRCFKSIRPEHSEFLSFIDLHCICYFDGNDVLCTPNQPKPTPMSAAHFWARNDNDNEHLVCHAKLGFSWKNARRSRFDRKR